MTTMKELREHLRELDKDLTVLNFTEDLNTTYINVEYKKKEVFCPYCKFSSVRVSSVCERSFQDSPYQGKCVIIKIKVRKMLCFNPFCKTESFIERLPFLRSSSRKSKRLEEYIINIFMESGASKAEGILKSKGVSITRRTIYQVLHHNTNTK